MRLKDIYQKKVIPEMQKMFGYKSIMAVPKIEKVSVNTGFGRMVSGKTSPEQKKISEAVLKDLSKITGQKPVLTKAKKSISSFKLREEMSIGSKVILRGEKMYDFLERIINIAFPRVRDFRGISLKSFDKKGNLTVAFKEQIIFPEISPEEIKITFGFEITIVVNAKTREEGIELFRLLGFPLQKV